MQEIISKIIAKQKEFDIDAWISNVYQKIPQNVKLTFCWSLIFSIIIHGFMFLNKFVSSDSIFNINHIQDTDWVTSLGRWLIPFIRSTRNYYNIPWFIGIFALSYLIITTCLVVSILKVKSKIYCILISFLMASMPVLSVSFAFDYDADVYTLALLFSVLAVYFTQKYKHGYILGSISVMLLLALYQSYIGFTLGLFTILLIKLVLDEKTTIKCIILKACNSLVCFIIGVGLYYVSVQIAINSRGIALASQAGTDAMGRDILILLPYSLRTTIVDFFDFFGFFNETGRFFYVTNLLRLLYVIITIALIYLIVKIIVLLSKQIIGISILRILLLVSLLMFLPISLNITEIMAPLSHRSLMEVYQFLLVIILVFVLSEIYSEYSKIKRWKSQAIVIIAAVLIGFNWTLTTSTYYFRIHIFYERTYAFYNRVLARIEEVDGFGNMPVIFVGSTPYSEMQGRHQFPTVRSRFDHNQFVGTGALQPYMTDYFQINRIRSFINDYFGVYLPYASTELRLEIVETQDFLTMPFWPHRDSVTVINGAIVVRFSYN